MDAQPNLSNVYEIMLNVSRGSQLLDTNNKMWYYDIDIDKLDLWSPSKCVLGQIYGTFITGALSLGLAKVSNLYKNEKNEWQDYTHYSHPLQYWGFNCENYMDKHVYEEKWIELINLKKENKNG